MASDTDIRPDGVWRFPCGDADARAAAHAAARAGPAPRVDATALPAVLAIYDRLARESRPRAERSVAAKNPDGTVRVG